jgi:hypothetical protein
VTAAAGARGWQAPGGRPLTPPPRPPAAPARAAQVHQETFGRSGCRRIVPGQYLACDPKGRAVMIAAVEKQKFVYVLNRDAAANLTISSPLEAHKSHNVVFSVAALDCGFDNPVFATIELDYSEADQVGRGGRGWGEGWAWGWVGSTAGGAGSAAGPHRSHCVACPPPAPLPPRQDPSGEAAASAQKQLVYYELDLGLNHVVGGLGRGAGGWGRGRLFEGQRPRGRGGGRRSGLAAQAAPGVPPLARAVPTSPSRPPPPPPRCASGATPSTTAPTC